MSDSINFKVFVGLDIDIKMSKLQSHIHPKSNKLQILQGLQEIIKKELAAEVNCNVNTPGPTIMRFYDTHNELEHFTDILESPSSTIGNLNNVNPELYPVLKHLSECDAMIEIEDPEDPYMVTLSEQENEHE
ncbi:hypothetical protein AYO36_15880 [Exiguobacterium sp. KKBO11]|uniref:hypothetical protein n=1 Tax=Exiguobacterium sp. KKBO11 TaxID=1805000 RepID=UPI0007D76FA5|nr:hypothetical protein [Exiguobacterium sp. KKBO11]OAI82164.1 hypothetical protein AYO36_15880 [Exiguobacterium sp. KKBO11]